MAINRTFIDTIRDAFTGPGIKLYRQHAQDTEEQLAALDDHLIQKIFYGARQESDKARVLTQRIRAEEFVYRLDRALRSRVKGTPPPATIEAEDMVTAALMLQALGELLEVDELDVRGRTLKAAAALRAAAGAAAAEEWHLDQARRDIARTLDRSRLG